MRVYTLIHFKSTRRYGNVSMKNTIGRGFCGFDMAIEMVFLSKLHALHHALRCARTKELSKLFFIRKNHFRNSEPHKSNIPVFKA